MKTFLIFLSCLAGLFVFGATPPLYIEKQGGYGNTNIFTNVNVFGAAYFASNAVISNVTKKAVLATSHSNPFLNVHSGNPLADTYWSWTFASATNSFDPAGTFDYLLSWGFNSSSSPSYKNNFPTIAWGTESHYVTSLGVPQAEHYMNFSVNSTNTHARPYGMSLFESYPPTVQWDWNIEDMRWNAPDGDKWLQTRNDTSLTNGGFLTLSRRGRLDFTGNTNYGADGTTYLIEKSGELLFGITTNGYAALSGPNVLGSGSNSIYLFPNFNAGNYTLHLMFGRPADNVGFRYSAVNSRMEYMNAGTWTAFNNNVFTAGITVSGGVSNVFNSPIRLSGADIWLNNSAAIYLGANASTIDKYQYIQGNVNGEPLTVGSYDQVVFKTGTSGSGGGTERFRINTAGITSSIPVTIRAGTTNSIVMLDTNGSTTTKIYTQGGTLFSSASPAQRTVVDDEWKAMNGAMTTTNIDGKSVANTTIYTVPDGRQLIVERIIIIPTTTAAVITPPTVSIGKTGVSYVDVIAAGALTGLTATLTSATLAPIVGASVIDSGESLVLRVSSGASATTYTFKAVVIGTLL